MVCSAFGIARVPCSPESINACSPILVRTEFETKVTVVSELHPKKAWSPMVCTSCVRVTSVIEVQFAYALSTMDGPDSVRWPLSAHGEPESEPEPEPELEPEPEPEPEVVDPPPHTQHMTLAVKSSSSQVPDDNPPVGQYDAV